MVNFELSVNNLKEKIKGIKLPGTLEDLRYSVEYGKTTVEVPISGIPNSAVVLEVLGESEKPKLVLENGEEVDLLEDGSINVIPAPAESTTDTVTPAAESTTDTVTPAPAESNTDTVTPAPAESTTDTVTPAPAEHTENPVTPAPAESTTDTVTPAPAESTTDTVTPAPAEHTENPVTPAPAEHTENPANKDNEESLKPHTSEGDHL